MAMKTIKIFAVAATAELLRTTERHRLVDSDEFCQIQPNIIVVEDVMPVSVLPGTCHYPKTQSKQNSSKKSSFA